LGQGITIEGQQTAETDSAETSLLLETEPIRIRSHAVRPVSDVTTGGDAETQV